MQSVAADDTQTQCALSGDSSHLCRLRANQSG